jgi:hypothetical protein
MKIEINEWLLNLPFFVSFFWIFIYKFEWRNMGLGKLNKKQKAIVKKEPKNGSFFIHGKDMDLKRPKNEKMD